jgi:hypothetical protein
MLRGTLAVVALLIGCAAPAPVSNAPLPPCEVDRDCGAGRYCGPAGVCRRDCLVDAHCAGGSSFAQCNGQGRCIEVIAEAGPPIDPPVDAGGDAILFDAPDAPIDDDEGGD